MTTEEEIIKLIHRCRLDPQCAELALIAVEGHKQRWYAGLLAGNRDEAFAALLEASRLTLLGQLADILDPFDPLDQDQPGVHVTGNAPPSTKNSEG